MVLGINSYKLQNKTRTNKLTTHTNKRSLKKSRSKHTQNNNKREREGEMRLLEEDPQGLSSRSFKIPSSNSEYCLQAMSRSLC